MQLKKITLCIYLVNIHTFLFGNFIYKDPSNREFASSCTNDSECNSQLGLFCNQKLSSCNYPIEIGRNFCDCNSTHYFSNSSKCGKTFSSKKNIK